MPFTDGELELLQAIENGEVEKVPFDNERIRSDASETMKSLRQKKDQYQYEVIRPGVYK